ncbi:MAG: long-chain-fatty-acid--CoA ligase [Alphaproteobacteria bacterium]|nr:long-chain-fatty-acid--CoA ligase [Alphaproteobacteria bacterium]
MNISYLVDRSAIERPHAPALLLDDGPPVTWERLAERIGRLAAAIAARGAKAGDRVALLAPNGPAFLETLLAAARIGAVIVPLNYRLSPAEINFQLTDADCALWFVDASFADLAEATGIAVPKVAIAPGGGAYEAMIEGAGAPVDLVPVAPDHTLGIFYTGGTTGLPKGVMLTHQNLLSNATHVAPRMHHQPDDIHLHAAPMFHLADLGATFAQLLAGGAHCFLAKFDAEGLASAVERHRVTTVGLPPTMLDMALRGDAAERHDLSSLRRINYGGSPITDAVLKRAFKVLPCELAQGYGQTEATQTITMLPPEDHRRAVDRPELLRTCGKPVDGVQVIIGDPHDQPVPVGEIGEVLVRGPIVMKGYWRREAETAEALRGGWLHTGDLGRRDAEGYITLVDRRKDMIITGAENVFSTEVENALTSHADVVEAAVVGVPDENYGERVHAVVVLRDGAAPDEAALMAHCRAQIGGYKIPRSFEFISELPKTGAGKVRKAELRAPHWEGHDRKVG